VINQLCDVLRREAEAALVLEGRLRALELVIASDEPRPVAVALALDEMEVAADNLAALELTRVLALSAAGLPVEGLVSDLVAGVADPAERAAMRQLIAHLATATRRLEQARDRAEVAVASGPRLARDRLHAVNRFPMQ
jgi:hypothetical protein